MNDSLASSFKADLLPIQQAENQNSLIDAQLIWAIFYSKKLLIGIGTFIFLIIAVVYALLAPKIYQSEILFFAQQSESKADLMGGLSSLVSFAGLGGGGSNEFEANLAVLQSRSFLQKFITEDLVGRTLINVLKMQRKTELIKQNSAQEDEIWLAYNQLKASMVIAVDRKTSMITLSIQGRDPQQASDLANHLVSFVNDHLRSKVIDESQKSIDFLNAQIIKVSEIDIKKTLYGLLENELKNIKLANARTDFAFNVIDPAVPAREAFKPNRKFIVFSGAVFGFVFSFFLVVLYGLYEKLYKK